MLTTQRNLAREERWMLQEEHKVRVHECSMVAVFYTELHVNNRSIRDRIASFNKLMSYLDVQSSLDCH